MKSILKKILIIFFCGASVFAASYAYLNFSFKKSMAKIDQKEENVPYEHIPDNAGIGFLLPDGSALLTYLNFKEKCINVINVEQYDKSNNMYFGYTMDYTVQVNHTLIAGLVDRVGGVAIRANGEMLRYTGVQVVDAISNSKDNDIKEQIITEIFRRISENGFSKEDFVYIIQNSKTDLSLLNCIYWINDINKICDNIVFID